MANSSAKKLLKSNRQRLTTLVQLLCASNLVFPVFRFLLLRRSLTPFHTISWVLLLLLSLAPMLFLWSVGRPAYAADGTLLDGGDDVSAPGVLEYAHDLIYLCVVTQTGLIFTRWAWLVMLVVPAYAGYVAFSSGLISGGGGGGEGADGDGVDDGSEFANMSRKDRRKAQRQARKQH